MLKKPLINNRIKARKIRLIDDSGKQMGVIDLEEALRTAEERNLDLIQVTEKIDPPVCKIMDYGKYLYRLQKKEKNVKKSTETKGIRLRFNISPHDLETRISQSEKFLKKGNRVKIEMALRGREKRLSNFAREKLKKFIEELGKRTPIKKEGEIRRGGRGFTAIVSASKEE